MEYIVTTVKRNGIEHEHFISGISMPSMAMQIFFKSSSPSSSGLNGLWTAVRWLLYCRILNLRKVTIYIYMLMLNTLNSGSLKHQKIFLFNTFHFQSNYIYICFSLVHLHVYSCFSPKPHYNYFVSLHSSENVILFRQLNSGHTIHILISSLTTHRNFTTSWWYFLNKT